MTESAKWDAGLYNDKHSFVWKMASGVLELLEPKVNEHILDVGCGTGHLTAKIAASGAQVTGIDRSPEMIREARKAYPAIRFEVLDAREIDLPEKFDAVFSNATLHWISEPERAIAGISAVLRQGGRFVTEFGGKGNNAGLVAAAEIAWAKLQPGIPLPNPWYYPGACNVCHAAGKTWAGGNLRDSLRTAHTAGRWRTRTPQLDRNVLWAHTGQTSSGPARAIHRRSRTSRAPDALQ